MVPYGNHQRGHSFDAREGWSLRISPTRSPAQPNGSKTSASSTDVPLLFREPRSDQQVVQVVEFEYGPIVISETTISLHTCRTKLGARTGWRAAARGYRLVRRRPQTRRWRMVIDKSSLVQAGAVRQAQIAESGRLKCCRIGRLRGRSSPAAPQRMKVEVLHHVTVVPAAMADALREQAGPARSDFGGRGRWLLGPGRSAARRHRRARRWPGPPGRHCSRRGP